jgi:hypothetical protein
MRLKYLFFLELDNNYVNYLHMKFIKIFLLSLLLPSLAIAQSIINTDVFVAPGAEMYFSGDDAEISATGIVHSNGNFGSSLKIMNAGKMMGIGSFEVGTTMTNSGIVSPGESPAILTINGAYTNGTSTLEIEIGGTTAGTQYDVLAVKNTSPLVGSASLSGTLNVTFINGFIPIAGDAFTILTADAGVTGTFTTTNVPDFPSLIKTVTYNANSVVVSYAAALPVHLISFNGKKTGIKENTLNWITAKEVDFVGFEIEKSRDGKSFEGIGNVKAQSNQVNYLNTYNFVDKDAQFDVNYYRLKMVDLDGSHKYSKIISIENSIEQSVVGVFYPNPSFEAKSNIDIVAKEKGDWVISQYNVVGNMLTFDTFHLEKGLNKISIGNLQSGLSFVRIQNRGTSEIRKVIFE